MGKTLQISLKLKFTPNTLGCYGLISSMSAAGPVISIVSNRAIGRELVECER